MPDDLTRLVLGPGRPEVTCDACFAQLDEYVERQLTSADAARHFPQFAAHLSGCPVCAEEYESLRDLVAATRGSDAP